GLGASGAVYGIIGCMIAYMVISGIDKDNAKGLIIRIACAMILFFMARKIREIVRQLGRFLYFFFNDLLLVIDLDINILNNPHIAGKV
ncbi:hypothetical protein II654_03020, partial [bacterium]|nr:hypothetical protein [bacterium]